jgi:hypothetical protein
LDNYVEVGFKRFDLFSILEKFSLGQFPFNLSVGNQKEALVQQFFFLSFDYRVFIATVRRFLKFNLTLAELL